MDSMPSKNNDYFVVCFRQFFHCSSFFPSLPYQLSSSAPLVGWSGLVSGLQRMDGTQKVVVASIAVGGSVA